MQKRAFLPLFLLTITLFGFQNCADFSANNMAFSSSADGAQLSSIESKNVDKLYYYFQKSSTKNDNKAEKYEVLFDLKNKIANLSLKSADELSPIIKKFNLSDKEIEKIKSLLKDVKIEKVDNLERIGELAEEYIIPYFNDSSSLMVYLETAEALIDGYKTSAGKDKISEILNDILTDHLDSSLILKVMDFLKEKKELINFIKKLIKKIQDIEISVTTNSSVSGSGSVTVTSGDWNWSKIFDLIF